ncbi:hypothetical protein [Corynebacterium sp.]|uniref:hypothetical protein n=1 Tax=Corynebacterium sp. TaxID=1720 RepID=UPI0028AD68A7|nr:hypothetical protein [Corynebacterium sp.]
MAVWVPVNAEMKGFVSHLVKEASGAGKQGAKKVADEFGKGGQEAGKNLADGLVSQAKLVDQATAKLSNARKVEAQAAARVTAAEKDLEILRASGAASASKLAAATQKLNTETNKQRDAAAVLARQESDLEAIQAGAEPTVAALARAEDALAKSRTDSQTAMDSVRTAEERLAEAKQLSEQRSAAVEAAEENLARVREESGADSREATKAEKELERAKKQNETASRAVAKEDGKLKVARAELESATDTARAKAKTYEAVQEDVARAEREAGDEAKNASKEIALFGEEAETASGSLGDFAKNVGTTFAGIAGVTSIGAAFTIGADFAGEMGMVNNQLGLTGEAAQLTGESMQEALGTGVVRSSEEAAEVIGALNAQWSHLGFEGEQTAGQLSDNFAAFSRTFGVDMAETTQTAGQLMVNGLATDAEHAADLMTSAMQRVPMQMRDELPEIINEYGVNFSNLGMSGEEAFELLVRQSEKGKWALDKTGDSLKEFANFAVDPAKAEVFESIGLNAEEMATKVAEGGPAAREQLEKTAQALLDIEDPGVRASTAIELFGTPMEDLGIDQIPQFLGSLTNLNGGMFGTEGASQQLADNISNSLGGRLDTLKGTVTSLAADGFMKLWDWGVKIADWAGSNSSWLTPLVLGVGALAGVIGLVVGGMALWSAATTAWTTITGIATGAQTLFNSTLLANPLVWITALIVGVGVALWAFFTKTETGRELWSKLMAGLSLGWDLFRFALAKGWEFMREKVFAPLISWVLNTRDRFMNFVDRTKEGWQSFQDKAGDVVTNVKNFVGDMITNISETPGKIKEVFSNAASWLVSAGRDIISGLWDGIRDMWDNVANWFTDLPSRIRNSVGSLSFSFGGLFSGNADGSFAQYVAGGIDKLEAYANGGGRENHVAQIARGKTPVRIWAEPETGGESYIPLAKSKRSRSTAILAKTAEIFGLKLWDPATGAPVQVGYSGNLGPQDVHAFANGGITGEDLDAFARGQTAGGYRASRPLQGAPYVWGGSDWGDCTGAVSAFAALAKGLNPFPRKFYTGDMGAWLNKHGFIRGRGKKGDFRIGYKHGGPGGGHTAATLPNGVNVEMGGSPSEGHYNTGAGAWDKYFDTFYHLPMQIAEVFNDKVVGGLGEINTPMVTTAGTASTAPTASTVSAQDTVPTRPLTPQEVAAATWSEEMGNRSAAELATDAVFDWFGEDSSTFKKLAFTPMNELLGVSGTDGASTSVAESNAVALNDQAVTTMTAEEMAKDPQLKALKTPEVIEQPKVASWGPEFFTREIAKKAKSMGLDKVAAKIGIATALVESGDPMKMYANHAVPESLKFRHDAVGSDHDSIGLFQQRSQGWGNVRQRMTPSDSAGFFFNALRKFDYKNMDPGQAAQRVQVSAFPDKYGKQMQRADAMLSDTGVFDKGGIARGIGFMPKATLRPEEVLSPDMTPLFRQFIGILPDVMDDYDGGALAAANTSRDLETAMASARSSSQRSESGGTTVVINLDGQEVLRQRLEDAEEVIDVHTDDIQGLKKKKKPKASTTTRGGIQ